jgi:hypothetical protein
MTDEPTNYPHRRAMVGLPAAHTTRREVFGYTGTLPGGQSYLAIRYSDNGQETTYGVAANGVIMSGARLDTPVDARDPRVRVFLQNARHLLSMDMNPDFLSGEARHARFDDATRQRMLDAIDLAWAKLPPKPNPGITPR